jgi:lysophospholipase L1-like esterase
MKYTWNYTRDRISNGSRHLLALLFLLFSHGPMAQTPDRWKSAMDEFAQADVNLARDLNPVLFIGSSSLRLWPDLQADFPGIPVLNRGFGGSQLSDVLYHFDQILSHHKPRAILLYEGDNDLASGKSTDEFMIDLNAFHHKVTERWPDIPVAFLAIKPSPSRAKLHSLQKQTNLAVKERCDSWNGWTFLDVATPLLIPDGTPDPLYFTKDRLHMNDNGYRVWRAIVQVWLDKVLPDSKSK